MAISYLFGREGKDSGDMMKQVPALILSKKLPKFVGRFFNLYDPKEMEAAFKAGMVDKCSTLVGEVARMTTKIILKKRESLREKAGQA